MIKTFLLTVWYLINPTYRRSVDRDFGYLTAASAGMHLLRNPRCDGGDIVAAKVLRQCMRECK